MKLGKYAIVAVLMSLSFTVTAFCAIPEKQDTTITVTGRIEPKSGSGGTGGSDSDGLISVVVPTKATFIVDEARNFISPDYTITNNSEKAKVSVTAKSIEAGAGTNCKVVADTKYTDDEWKALSNSDATVQIALGLNVNNHTNWFKAEGTDSNISLGEISAAGGTLTTNFNGKYGHNWGNSTNITLNYSMPLIIEVIS